MSQVDLEDDAFERIAARQAKLELQRNSAKLAAEKALLEMDVKAAEHFQAQIIREFAQRISKNYMSVSDAMLELQKIKERGIEFAYLEFERVAGECDSTIDAILSANRK